MNNAATYSMKTIRIISKTQAQKIFTASTFHKMKYCNGKYGHTSFPVGKEVNVHERIEAMWTERRKDQDGHFKVLFCLVSRS